MSQQSIARARLAPLLCLSLLFPAAISEAADANSDALPVTVFKHLEAGEKQTVIVYGTSLTIKGAWSQALRDYFERNYPGQIQFINAAKAGMTSDWGIENLQKRVLEHKPDMVFLEFSANDAATKNKVSQTKSKSNLDAMVTSLRRQNPGISLVLQTMNPAWDSPRVKPKQYGSERPELEAYYAIYRDYANAHDLPLIDHYPTWAKLLKEDPDSFHKAVPDGIHPSSGASLGRTWPAVEEMMNKARAAAMASATTSVKQ